MTGTRQSANSHRPLDRLKYVFAFCDPVTLTFDLILNEEPARTHPRGTNGDCSFSCFDSIV